VDKSNIARGEIRVGWKILEAGDGASLQLTIAGPTTVEVVANAAVDGQRQIARIDPHYNKPARYEQSPDHGKIGAAVVGTLVLWLALSVLFGEWRTKRTLHWFTFFVISSIGGLLVLSILFGGQQQPPFGF